MEYNASCLLGRQSKYCVKVPADGLSLAVLIGCQPHDVTFLDLTLESAYKLLLLGRYLILRLKSLGVYAELLFLEVAYVTVTRHNLVILAKELLDCLCFCR